MKKSYFVIILLVSLFISSSCSKKDSECVVISVQTKTLVYDEINGQISWNPDFLNKTYLFYSNNKIVKTKGGPYKLNDGTSALIRFSNDVGNAVWYEGNRVITEDNFNLNNLKLIEYTIESGILLNKKELFLNQNPPFVIDYSYIYNGNEIEEKRNNAPFRKFYMESGNLVRVEQLIYNINQEIIGRTDLIFSDFDTQQNFIKGLYFIKGAFYNAFSNNNPKRNERKSYDYSNGVFVYNSMNSSANWTNTTEGLFELECD